MAADPAADGGSPSAPGRYRGVHRARRTTNRRVVLGTLLVAGAAAILLAVRPWAGTDDARGVADPALARMAAWIADELPADTPVTASAEVRAALDAAGAAGRVGGPAEGALQVVEGEPAAGALVLARFERADGTPLNVVDPEPARPTDAELERRRSLGEAVLANPVAAPTGRAAEALRTGHIDPRLLGLLAGLVSRMDVHVADLPPAPGEPDDGPPARRLLVDEAGGEPLTPGAAATDHLVAFLEAQRPPFAPDAVERTDDGVLVAFDYVSAPETGGTAANP